MLIIRRLNCINISSGTISLCEGLLGMPVRRDIWFIGTFSRFDDRLLEGAGWIEFHPVPGSKGSSNLLNVPMPMYG